MLQPVGSLPSLNEHPIVTRARLRCCGRDVGNCTAALTFAVYSFLDVAYFHYFFLLLRCKYIHIYEVCFKFSSPYKSSQNVFVIQFLVKWYFNISILSHLI